MAELSLSIEQIKSLMDKMQQTNLGELKIKEGSFELRLEAKKPTPVQAYPPCVDTAPVNIAVAATASPSVSSIETANSCNEGNVVKSPIVGTFYSSAAPDKPAFVTVGSHVKKGDVLFIIESMKLMNEVQSDFSGEVTEIMASEAQGVEYGQPIMRIK